MVKKQASRKARPQKKDSSEFLLILLLVVTTIIAYVPAFNAGLINWDEKRNLLETPVIQKLNWENIKEIFSTKVLKSYNPLVVLSFAVDYHFVKLSAGWYHTVNIILHIFNSILVYFCCKSLLKNNFIAAIAAFLFALHPIHVESVAWIASRKDVLYTFFFLLSWLLYMQQKKLGYYLSVFLFLLALLSKSQAVTLPLVLLLTDYLQKKQWDWKFLTNKVPYFILSLIFGYITIHGSSYVADKYAHALTFSERIIYSVIAFGLYVYKALLPVNQTAIYAFTKNGSAEYFIQLIGGIALIATAIYLTIRYWKKSPILVFGILFFAVNIFLTLHIIAVNSSLIYERFTYISYIGMFIIAASFIQKLSVKTARPVAIGLLIEFTV